MSSTSLISRTHVLISFTHRILMNIFMLELDPSFAVGRIRMPFDGMGWDEIETKSLIGFLSIV